jgi:cation:H+ antiporter
MALYGLLSDSLVLSVVLVVVTMGCIQIGSGWLESSAEELSLYYGLPPVIQGSVVVAIGSSFPELASVVFAAWFENSFDLGVGAVVGSAIFNVLVIPALAGILTEEPIDSNRTIVYKEAQFYMLAVSVMVITFAMAVIYAPDESTETLDGQVTPLLALMPLLLYGLYLFIQWQDVADHEADEDGSHVDPASQWGLLAAGLVVILVAVEQLVHAVGWMAGEFGINQFLAGVTIVAAATSVPDALVSVRAARAGKGVTSIGNVLGSNTFDLLVAIPVGVLIAGNLVINFAIAVPMMGVLTVATIVLFVALRTGLSLSRIESYGLLLLYLVFVAWVVAETVGVTSYLQMAQ